jgi:hypothetical protein
MFKNSIMKPTKHCECRGGGRVEWEYKGGDEFVQVCYTHELPQ